MTPQSRCILTFAVVILGSGTAAAQTAVTIEKTFSPATINVGETSILTVTVTNPNDGLALNVTFSDTMPTGITLITQTGGTCSTLATGGGMFTINPGTGFFSSTSNSLSFLQSCTITVQVRGTAAGSLINTTSTVTATALPAGTAASATLTVNAVASIPALSTWGLLILGMLLAVYAAFAMRKVQGQQI